MIIYLKYQPNIKLTDDLRIGSIFMASTAAFYRFLSKQSENTYDYLYSLDKLLEFEQKQEFPILLYLGNIQNHNHIEYMFLVGLKICYLPEQKFKSALPLKLTILNG